MSSQYPRFASSMVGFDNLFDLATRMNHVGYPPHNIARLDESTYLIELAVAGFAEADIDLTLEGNVLTVQGNKSSPQDVTYIHKGISEREFRKSFTLGENIQIGMASLESGLLKIELKHVIPENLRPRKISLASSGDKKVQLNG